MALPNGLLDDVRNYLDITWEDSLEDTKLTGIIARGMKYIDRVAGAPMDYTQEGQAKELLMDYCRYVRAKALEDYAKNFLPELLSLQMHQEVQRYEEETANI